MCFRTTDPNQAVTVSQLKLTVKVYFKGSVISTKKASANKISHLTAQTIVGCHNGTYHTHVDATVVWGYQIDGVGDKVPRSNTLSLSSQVVDISTCGAT